MVFFYYYYTLISPGYIMGFENNDTSKPIQANTVSSVYSLISDIIIDGISY